MSMVMDEAIDVDDLFGDPNSLELNLNSAAPAVRGLSQKLDELRLLGCCRKIAWSRAGAIAYISEDRQKVFIRYLICRPEDGKWLLSEGKFANLVTEAHGGHTFIHLSWNDMGFDLAVVDSCGRISTFGISNALNALSAQRPATIDPGDDGNQPVGLMWLCANRPIYALQKAVKTNGMWTYSRFARRPIGPLNPANKNALVCVTRSGHLRFIYQSLDSKWGEIASELKNTGYSSGILTHAALVPVEGSGILVATYTYCGRLCLYRATIKWEPAQSEPAQPRQGGSSNIPQTPSIQLVHIKSEYPRFNLNSSGATAEGTGTLSPAQTSLFKITHLEIITASPEAPGGVSPPVVLAVFSSSPVFPDGQSHPSSVLIRWEVGSMTQALHSSFDDVVSKKSATQLRPKPELIRQEDVYFDRFIVSVDCLETGNLLALTFDDSNISFLDARSMKPLGGLDNISTVTSMAQAGFTFPTDTSGLHIAFSQNGCVAVVQDGEGQLHLRVMEHTFGAEDGLYNDGKFSSAIAALALVFGRACGSDTALDDVLLVAVRYLTADAQKVFIDEAYRALAMNADFTIEQDKLMQNPYIQKCLSLQAGLGFNPSLYRRSPSSAVAWFTIQLREISILFTYFWFFHKSTGDAENYEPDILRIILGNVKWALDLAKFLVDDLFDLADNLESQSSDSSSGPQPAKYFDNLTVVLILSSVPRSFLKYICRGLRGMAGFFRTATNLTTESFQLYSKIVALIEESPVRVDVYEKFLASVDSVVNHAYGAAGFNTADRASPERELLTTSNVPPVLQPAVSNILTSTVSMIRPEVDQSRLYLYDYSWLGICDDKLTQTFRQTFAVDALKRTVAKVDGGTGNKGVQPKRRCVRCCSISDEVVYPRSLPKLRMLAKTSILRTCPCGGAWVVEKRESDE